MDWTVTRAGYQTRLNNINTLTPTITALIATADSAIQNYIEHYDTRTAEENQTAYAAIQTAMNDIQTRKDKYQVLHDDIIATFTQYSSKYDLTTKLIENGTLQISINQLQKTQDELRTDVETAVARDELLRSHETDTTSHSLFLRDRPIRKEIVPYLWVIAVLFVGLGLLFFHQLAPSFNMEMGVLPWYAMLTQTLLSQQVLLAVLAACILTIIGLSLKVAGVF